MPVPTAPPPRRLRLFTAALAALIAAAFVLPLVLMRGKSATYDEVFHLPAGYSYLATGAVTIHTGHPPLVKELCALPLLFLDVRVPVDSRTLHDPARLEAVRWGFVENFLYIQDADRLLFWGRVPAVLLSAGLALLIGLWSRRLWGPAGALLAVFLYVFDPTITAHSQLVATDVGLAFFSVLALFALRAYLQRSTRLRLLAAGAALGLALGTKYSALVLLPLFALLLVASRWRSGGVVPEAGAPAGGSALAAPVSGGAGRHPAARRALAALVTLAVMAVTASLVLWAVFLFPSDPLFYFRGLQQELRAHDPNYEAFLLGAHRPALRHLYLLIAWSLKTPLPSLLLLGAAVAAFLRGRRTGPLEEAFLLLPAFAYGVVYSAFSDNLGVRYLIPAFPFLFIFAGRLAPAAAGARRRTRALLGALLLWTFAEYVAIWPDHLSYFNQIAGGPARGPMWLDDSNVDWGQGLIQLRDYLRRTGLADYRLGYFGSGRPSYYGIRPRRLYTRDLEDLLSPSPAPGTYILSAHFVARLRGQLARLYGPGNWLARASLRDVVGHAFYIYEVR